VWEVPDLFPLELNGRTIWVLLVSVSTLAPASGGGVQYFLGSFDGRTFTTDQSEVLWLDYGPDNYAGTTWSDAPDNRRLYIGWLNNWQYAAQIPTSVWRGAATLPRELTLVQTPQGMRLRQTVPTAFRTLRTSVEHLNDVTLADLMLLDSMRGRALEIELELDPGTAERIGIAFHRDEKTQARIVYNVPRKQLVVSRGDAKTVAGDSLALGGFNPAFGTPVELVVGRLLLHIFVDQSSVEVFAQDGTVAISSQIFVDPDADGVALFAEGGTGVVKRITIYSLHSIWPEPSQIETLLNGFNYC
jgi:fructan beta-fructosidase